MATSLVIAAASVAVLWLLCKWTKAEGECDALRRDLMYERLERMRETSQYGRMLGKVVEAKVYAESDWQRMVVVAVSWKGAVAVRPESDMETRARWIRRDLVPYRVREAE